RTRDKDVSEGVPNPRRLPIGRLQKTVAETCQTIVQIPDGAFSREYGIQGYRVSGLVAIAHVYEHFAYHTGQIIYLTKLKRGKDLRFTRLPAAKPAARAAGRRP